jgi:hypothetical protein
MCYNFRMITYQILEGENIVIIEPKDRLSEADFRELARDVDLHLARTETLEGILIHTPAFPGWDSIGTMITHLRFVRDHHRLVKKVAIASDNSLANLIPNLANHFVDAKVKSFAFDERDEALAWLKR